MKKNKREVKLNEKPIVNKSTKTKEGNTMKKNRRNLLAMLTACIFMMCALAGCESNQPVQTTQQPETTVAQPTEEVKTTEAPAAPTEVEQPTEVEAPSPTEEVTPTEIVSDDPNVVSGIDFTDFNTGECPLRVNLERQNVKITEPMIIMLVGDADGHLVVDGVLKNEETYKRTVGVDLSIRVFGSQIIKDAKCTSGAIESCLANGSQNVALVSPAISLMSENEEYTFELTYEDGTTDTITFYVAE